MYLAQGPQRSDAGPGEVRTCSPSKGGVAKAGMHICCLHAARSGFLALKYSKTCVKRPLKNRQNKD